MGRSKRQARKPRPDPPLLSDLADDAEMADLVAFFLDDLDRRVDRLNQAWADRDFDELRALTNHLRGAAGGYGFPKITRSAAELEQALLAEQADAAALAERVEALITLCRQAIV